MGLLLIVVIAVSVASVMVIVFSVRIYSAKFGIRGARRGLEAHLNQRCHLISRLVLMVQGRIRPRKERTTELIIMMGRVMGAESFQRRIELEDDLTLELSNFIDFMEEYPDLKRNPVLIQIEKELVLGKERIYSSLNDYHDHIKRFNQLIRRFPYCFLRGANTSGANTKEV